MTVTPCENERRECYDKKQKTFGCFNFSRKMKKIALFQVVLLITMYELASLKMRFSIQTDIGEDDTLGSEVSGNATPFSFALSNNHTRNTTSSVPPIADFQPNRSIYERQTAVAVISFGNATASTYVERCLRSLRMRGNFHGHFVVVTDASPGRYASLKVDPHVVVLQAQQQDLNTGVKYKTTAMLYKRFKTLLPAYMDLDDRLKEIRTILYMDVDILVTNDLHLFLHHYHEDVVKPFKQSKEFRRSKSYCAHFVGCTRYPGWKKGFLQPPPSECDTKYVVTDGGLFVLDRVESVGCMDKWRHEWDRVLTTPRDQQLLRNIQRRIRNQKKWNKAKKKPCSYLSLDNKKHYFVPAKENEFMKPQFSKTFTHLTNTNIVHFGVVRDEVMQNYLKKALLIPEEESGLAETKQLLTLLEF
jgi:hypothetical protein